MTAIPYGDTVMVRRKTRDRFGDVSTAPPFPVRDVAIYPASSGQIGARENTFQADTVSSLRTIYPPAGSDIRAYDEIQLPGDERWWEVDGAPGDWTPHLARYQSRMQVNLVLTSG